MSTKNSERERHGKQSRDRTHKRAQEYVCPVCGSTAQDKQECGHGHPLVAMHKRDSEVRGV